jgi:predicted PurR-regulated permease PerM
MSGPAPRDITRVTLTVFLVFVLMAAVLWILRPFLPSLIWATMIVVATWPVMLTLQKHLGGRRGLATVIMTVGFLLVFFVPFWLAVSTIVDNASRIGDIAVALQNTSLPGPPEWVGKIPVLGSKVSASWHQLSSGGQEELTAQLKPYTGKMAKWFVDQAGNVGKIFVQFLLTAIITAILYVKGDAAAESILRFSRHLGGIRAEEATLLAGRSIRGVALGVVVTALVQSVLGGIGLAVTGVSAASLLTAVMFMLCVAQVGPGLVLIPAIIWLYWSGQGLWATVLVVWAIVVMSLDNFLRPMLIKKGADLPLLLIFAGVIGGLMAFGIVGIFIGPMVLAVSHTLLQAWMDEVGVDAVLKQQTNTLPEEPAGTPDGEA